MLSEVKSSLVAGAYSRGFTKVLLPLSVFLVGSLILAAVVLAKPKPTPSEVDDTPALIQVPVTSIRPSQDTLTVRTQGTVMPKHEIDLVAEVSGRIQTVQPAYVAGGFFEREQSLLAIDDRDYLVALMSAKARLADAERRLAEERGLARQAKREWRDLGNQQANDLFVRKPQLAFATASLEFAKADLAKAELDVERTRIRAPFTGRIKAVAADLGQYVSKGSKVATIYDTSIATVRLPLTEKQAALVNLPLTKSAAGSPAKVVLSGVIAGEAYQWHGVLARADAYVDANSRMYYAIVEIPVAAEENRGAPLIPGVFVTAKIEGKTLSNVVKLPRAALYKRDQIFVVDDENLAKKMAVKVLRKTPDYIWVKGDLAASGRVVLDKQSLLKEGAEVSPFSSDQKTEQATPTVAASSIEG